MPRMIREEFEDRYGSLRDEGIEHEYYGQDREPENEEEADDEDESAQADSTGS